jgi:hypothetical protein
MGFLAGCCPHLFSAIDPIYIRGSHPDLTICRTGIPPSVNGRNLSLAFLMCFNELLAYYAKHLERYFSTIDDDDQAKCFSEFTQVLLLGIDSVAQERYHSPSSTHALTGERLEGMIYALATAERELSSELKLRITLHDFNFPEPGCSHQSDQHPAVLDIHKQRCPLATQESED